MFALKERAYCHLSYTSPCRNSGNYAGVDVHLDFEGDPRITDGVVDMGADEFHPHFYCTSEFSPGGSIEGKFIGAPNTWPVGLLIGSDVKNPPQQHAWGELYLESPLYLYPLVPIPANGVLAIPETLPITAAPYDVPMKAMIGWKLSNLFLPEVR